MSSAPPNSSTNGSPKRKSASSPSSTGPRRGCRARLRPQPRPPRSALWCDSRGKRFGPLPLVGYTDTRYLVEQICKSPGQYSWQILNQKIALKELAVSGSDYMTAFRHKKKIKSLGGVKTDLESRVLDTQDRPIPGLYAVGETAGFGGGGIHGNIQLFKGEVDELPVYQPARTQKSPDPEKIKEAARILASARSPGLFLGWGAADAMSPSAPFCAMTLARTVIWTYWSLLHRRRTGVCLTMCV